MLFVVFFPLVLFFSQHTLVGLDRPVNTVVIDPGHGGNDPGAVGRQSLEKDVNLTVSLKVGELINQYFPDVKVIFTRKTDVFVGLNERAQVANRNDADLFISIHCNGAGNRSVQGSETFVMGNDKNQSNLAVAMKENASIYFEDDYQDIYDGFDPNKPETHIIFSLFQHQYITQSLKAASLIQDQFRDKSRRLDRGVKQGPFLVLHRTSMPAVLIELGFITNEDEEKFMISNEGQNNLASSIFRAFRDYKNSQDQLALSNTAQMSQSAAPAHSNNQGYAQNQPTQPKENYSTRPQPLAHPQIQNPSPSEPQHEAQTQQGAQQLQIREPSLPMDSNPRTDRKMPNVVFKVQFYSSDKLLAKDSPLFKGLKNVGNYRHAGLFRYTVGNDQNHKAAIQLQANVRNLGFKDAFVVAFINGERATVQEAQKLLGQYFVN